MKEAFGSLYKKYVLGFINSRHNLVIIYLVVMAFLMMGLVSDSGFTYLPYLLVYTAVFVIAYFGTDSIFKSENKISASILKLRNKFILKKADTFVIFLLFASLAFIILHFFLLGGIPTYKAITSNNSFDIYKIRRAVTEDSSALVNYVSSFLLRAILPFLLIYFYQKGNKKIFILAVLIALLYGLSLVAKSYLVTIFIPLLIFTFYNRDYIKLIIFSVIIFAGLNFLVFVSNPALRTEDTNPVVMHEPQPKSGGELEKSFSGLLDRTFFIPGKTVSGWFKAVPTVKPYLHGCGYHIISDLKNCEFREYNLELYPVLYPEYASLGYKGTVNTASFMYDYVNFGLIGIIYSAIILGIFLSLLNVIFTENNFLKLAINIFYVLVLSSSSFLTLSLSGGWFLIILLYLLSKNQFNKKIISP